MPNIGENNKEFLHYEFYDTLEINATMSGQRVSFFTTPQGQRSNLTGTSKNEWFTNMTLAGVLPEGESFTIKALRLYMFQNPEIMVNQNGDFFPDDQLLKGLLYLSSIRLTVQNKEYLTLPGLLIGAGAGVSIAPAIGMAAAAAATIDKTAATNGTPTLGSIYVLSTPLDIGNQEPFRVELSISPALRDVMPDVQTDPDLQILVGFALAGTLRRPVQ